MDFFMDLERRLPMKDKETMIEQAKALDMDPFDFVYRVLQLKYQECELLKREIEEKNEE